MSAAAVCCGSWRLTLGCQVSCVMSVEVARFGMRVSRYTHLIPDVCSSMCCGLAVDMRRIGDVCCLPAPVHHTFSSNSLDLSAPEEAYSRNVGASGTLVTGNTKPYTLFPIGSTFCSCLNSKILSKAGCSF